MSPKHRPHRSHYFHSFFFCVCVPKYSIIKMIANKFFRTYMMMMTIHLSRKNLATMITTQTSRGGAAPPNKQYNDKSQHQTISNWIGNLYECNTQKKAKPKQQRKCQCQCVCVVVTRQWWQQCCELLRVSWYVCEWFLFFPN